MLCHYQQMIDVGFFDLTATNSSNSDNACMMLRCRAVLPEAVHCSPLLEIVHITGIS